MAEIRFDTRPAGPPLLIIPEKRHTTAQQPISAETVAIAPTPTLLISTFTLSMAALFSLVIAVDFFIVFSCLGIGVINFVFDSSVAFPYCIVRATIQNILVINYRYLLTY